MVQFSLPSRVEIIRNAVDVCLTLCDVRVLQFFCFFPTQAVSHQDLQNLCRVVVVCIEPWASERVALYYQLQGYAGYNYVHRSRVLPCSLNLVNGRVHSLFWVSVTQSGVL